MNWLYLYWPNLDEVRIELHILFICDLFNDVAYGSHYIALNDGVITE
jgi:hypothetical protein